jgi:hypothetical protein
MSFHGSNPPLNATDFKIAVPWDASQANQLRVQQMEMARQ